MAEKLVITSQQLAPAHRVLKLSGTLVLTTIFEFQNIVRADTTPELTLDFSQVPYVDSAGIGALVNAHVSRVKNGRKLALAGVNKRVMDALKITKVDSVFTFLPAEASPERAN